MTHIIDLLQIRDAYKIGSSSDPRLKYTSDVDLEEYHTVKGSSKDVLSLFQSKFIQALENPNIWITDFKCGENFNHVAFRWSYNDIMNGYTMYNKEKIYFTDQLLNKSVIKIDVVAIEEEIFREYSSNYYFTIGKHKTKPTLTSTVKLALLNDAISYQRKNNYFKSLKRIYSFYKKIVFDDKNNIEAKKEINKLVELFNSPIGKLYQSVSHLNTILIMLNQKFRPVKPNIIISNIKYIQNETNHKYNYLFENILNDTMNLKYHIEVAATSINEDVNDKLFKYIDKHEINISPINIYNTYVSKF